MEYLNKNQFISKNLHDVAASFRVRINAVNRGEDQFLLQMTQTHHIFLRFLCFDLGVARDDT